MPEIVPTDLRPSANLLNYLGPAGGRAFGPLLAGILIAVRNAATAFFGLVAVYAVSVVVIIMRLPASRPRAAASASAIQQIADGLRYIRRTPVIYWTMFLATFPMIFLGMRNPLLPAIAVEALDTSAVQFGWMYGAQSIGGVSSAILLGLLGGFRCNGPAMAVGALMAVACLVPFGLTHTYWLALVYLFCIGLGGPLWIAAQLTLLQNFTAQEYRGRVIAVYSLAWQAASSVAWLLGGWLIDVIGIFPTVLVAVGGTLSLYMIAMIASKELRSS